MAAKPPGGVPPKAPAAPRAPQAPRIPIAPPTPRVSVEEAARAAAAVPIKPRPPSAPDLDTDWEQTEVTKPHDVMLSRDDVRAIVENTTSGALLALRAGNDEIRARLAKMEERITLLERSQLTPVAPAVRAPSPAPAPVVAAPAPVMAAPAPVMAAPVMAAPAPVAAPVVIAHASATPPPLPAAALKPAPVSASDPFAAVQAPAPPPRVERISVDLSPDEMLFDGAKRNRRISIVVILFLLISVGTFIGIAMTSQMRAGH